MGMDQIHLVRGSRARLKSDGTRAETRFGLSEKWTSPFKSAGESVQSTTGSQGVRISGQTMDRPCSEVQCKSSGYPLQSPISPSLPPPTRHHVPSSFERPLMLDTPCSEVVWRVLATHSIRQFPLRFPSRASPCAITFKLDSTSKPLSVLRFANSDFFNITVWILTELYRYSLWRS